MRDYPAMADHTRIVEPVPRRIRGYVATAPLFDTVGARYVLDTTKYPAYHIPVADVDFSLLRDEDRPRRLRRGPARSHGLVCGDQLRSGAAQVFGPDALAGEVLATSSAPVLVFETGLPTRYYVDRTDVSFAWLSPSPTGTECPYKGRTSDYWSAAVGDVTVDDIAWSYAFPTRALSPIANLVAFYNEHTDITVDGVPLERPQPVRG